MSAPEPEDAGHPSIDPVLLELHEVLEYTGGIPIPPLGEGYSPEEAGR